MSKLKQNQTQLFDSRLKEIGQILADVARLRLMFCAIDGSCVLVRTRFQTNAQEPNDARE